MPGARVLACQEKVCSDHSIPKYSGSTANNESFLLSHVSSF